MSEEQLTGGNIVESVVRIGEEVHRTRNSRSPFVAEVLLYLESVGFPHAPRYLGTDSADRDVFTFVPGQTTDHPSQRAAGAYAGGGRILRLLHDVTAGHPLAAGAECLLHGDPGAFNTVFQDGLPVALIDWDACRPGDRLDDLGYAAWTWCIQTTGHVPIDDQAAHVRELRDGYDCAIGADDLLAAIDGAQDRIIRLEGSVAASPSTPDARRAHARWAVEWATADRALVDQHRGIFRSVLS